MLFFITFGMLRFIPEWLRFAFLGLVLTVVFPSFHLQPWAHPIEFCIIVSIGTVSRMVGIFVLYAIKKRRLIKMIGAERAELVMPSLKSMKRECQGLKGKDFYES